MELHTELSRVDGTGGMLRYRGYEVGDVARDGLPGAVARLWHDRKPQGDEGLGAARAWASEQLERVAPALAARDGMDALRGAIGLLPSTVTDLQLVGAMAVFGSAWIAGTPVVADPALDHGTDVLRMALGTADADRGRALDTYLATVADHGTNASTFAARVVASTGSDVVSAVVAALGALKGPLHGGAPGPVLDMLDATEGVDDLEAWVQGELDAGRRIMGFGHRVYRARDPRAVVLEGAARTLRQAGRLPHAARLERAVDRVLQARHPDRVLAANVEFATAVLLEAVGLPREAFTVAFAMGRVVGWLSHVGEQRATGRLIRPRATYVGRDGEG